MEVGGQQGRKRDEEKNWKRKIYLEEDK